jgi:hypothetical protein
MSHDESPAKETPTPCRVGWEAPLGTCFAQVHRKNPNTNEAPLVFLVGTSVAARPTLHERTGATGRRRDSSRIQHVHDTRPSQRWMSSELWTCVVQDSRHVAGETLQIHSPREA